MRRLRIALATGAIAVAMAQVASAADPATTTTTTAETPPPPAATTPPPTGVTVTPTPVPPAPSSPKPGGQGDKPGSSGNGANHQGGSKQNGNKGDAKQAKGDSNGNQGATNDTGGAALAPTAPGISALGLTGLAPTSCATGAGAPLYLLPIYQQASDSYGLGPQGPGVLAAINGIESGFGANLGPSSAGAVGWMQFMPSTWATYGVDANGDGKADPNDPQDAIFAAARYLQAAGMPVDTASAIFAYNHADWYVAAVLADAGCYGGSISPLVMTTSGIQTLTCKAASGTHVPLYYMQAFEDAAGRFGLGERGVWALAAVARLESNFGRSMPPGQLLRSGPLGLDRDEWNRFEIDGDGDGRIEHVSIEDSAATLAREIWSRGSLSAGLFLHNQAEWYVQQVLEQANQISGTCTTASSNWDVALPEASGSLTNSATSNPVLGWQRGRIDMGVDFSAAPGTPIRAPLDALVVKVGAPGWPGGGGGVLLQLANGTHIFIYESVQALVAPGERVQAGQVIAIGSATAASTGIEIGFADANGSPLAAPVYSEGDVTAWGQQMALFLSELGVP